MDTILKDLQYAVRTLVKKPIFTIVALLVLALGIGANTIVFSIVYGVLLKPLPFRDPDTIVSVKEHKGSVFNGRKYNPAYMEYQEWQRQQGSFQTLAGFRFVGYTLTGAGNPEQVIGVSASPDFFQLLGAQPILGTTFSAEGNSSAPEVVLAYRFWQRRFGGSRDVVGQPVTLNAKQYVVIGVMPADFAFPDRDTELWTMITPADEYFSVYVGMHVLQTIGRLKPGVSETAAQSEMNVIQRQVDEKFPDGIVNSQIAVERLQDDMSGSARPALLILQFAVLLVLLIACANVASLLIGRASERRKEIAIRSALGANRSRLVRQMLTESLLLALAGGGLGLFLADVGLSLFLSANPFQLPRTEQISINSPILFFTLGVVVLTGVLFGLIPAIQAPKVNVSDLLKEDARGTSASARSHRTRSLLVVAEVALSVMLLVGAGLMMESLRHLSGVRLGIRPDNVLTMGIQLGAVNYPKAEQRWAFLDGLLQKVSGAPGVESAGLTSSLPIAPLIIDKITIAGNPPRDQSDPIHVEKEIVTPGYFKAMGVELVRGREFDDNDRADTENVTVINQTMARLFFGGEEPIGRLIKHGQPEDPLPWMKVVGIVDDVRHLGLDSQDGPEMFLPYRQVPDVYANMLGRRMSLAIKTSANAALLRDPIRDIIWSMDPDMPVSDIKTMVEMVSQSAAEPRMRTALLGTFAIFAIIMAAVGLYGVMSQAVLQRRHELGIRIALGATSGNILGMVVREGMVLAVAGLAVGVAGALALTRLASTLLFGVGARDPITFALVSIILLAVSLVASYLPARQATRVDPLSTLRSE
jgi:putative ABC transport system permease protein